jgi:hypothetical protein
LRRRRRSRNGDLERHVQNDLRKSASIANVDVENMPFADVPFGLTVATDSIYMNNADNFAVGDFATVGTVLSARIVPDNVDRLTAFTASIQNLRRTPTPKTLPSQLTEYNKRYSAEVGAALKPSMHGDYFTGKSLTNTAAGDFATGFTYQTFSGGEAKFSVDENYNAYDVAATAIFDPDTFEFVVGAEMDGQLGNDVGVPENYDLTEAFKANMIQLFFSHSLIVQMKRDVWFERISERNLYGIKTGFQCTDATHSSFIPSAANNDITSTRSARLPSFALIAGDGEGDSSEAFANGVVSKKAPEWQMVDGHRERVPDGNE